MGFFSKKSNDGGLINVIRCDKADYLVWKWRPNNKELSESKRENGIRFGSSLRVKDGEMAIFVYKNGQDVIVGPHDEVIKTSNFPVLASIVGMAFGGDTPFQAEIYFINLAQNIQLKFGVPYFDVFDPRYPDLPIPLAVRGVITYNLEDYQIFIKNNRLRDITLDEFRQQIRAAVMKYVKAVIYNIASSNPFPIVQIESKILEVNDAIAEYIGQRFTQDFGVRMKALDIEALEINKQSDNYKNLKRITTDIVSETTLAQSEINIKNLHDTQRINLENMEETLRIQREEAQRAQRLQTEQANIAAHALNLQENVLEKAAESLGKMGGNIGGTDGNSGGFNPAGIMTGMMMGGALGGQMSNMMNQMGQSMNNTVQQGLQTPPPLPQAFYYIYINGQQMGPYDMNTLTGMAKNGILQMDTLVWKQGMAQWTAAKDTELSILFQAAPSNVAPPPLPPTI